MSYDGTETLKHFSMFRNHGVLTELKQLLTSGYGRLPGYQVTALFRSSANGEGAAKFIECLEASRI